MPIYTDSVFNEDLVSVLIIMRTCPCNISFPYFLMVKMGYTGGVHHVLIFALKHRLWVLVRTASLCTHNLCFEQKYENDINKSTENCNFYSCEKCSILLGVFS